MTGCRADWLQSRGQMKPPVNGIELLREYRVHLTHRLLHALGLAHVEHLLEILDRGVDRDKLHAGAAAVFCETHAHLPRGELWVDVAVGVREGVLDVQRSWRGARHGAPGPPGAPPPPAGPGGGAGAR